MSGEMGDGRWEMGGRERGEGRGEMGDERWEMVGREMGLPGIRQHFLMWGLLF